MELEDMITQGSLISNSERETDTCYNEYPAADRSRLKEESSTKSYIDSETWFPPEADNQEDDTEGSVANYGDGMGKPIVSSRYGENLIRRFTLEVERICKLNVHMQACFKKQIQDLLIAMGVPCSRKDGDTWPDIVADLAVKAVSYMNPDDICGKQVDPNVYLEVQCIARGSRNQSKVFKGLVFRKHAAHKQMPTKYVKPKLLLIGGVPSADYDVMGMIEKLNPNVILVEKTVSCEILESILAKGMTLVLHMNRQRLEKVARCTGSRIFSCDELNDQELRQCKSFYFKKIQEQHDASRCYNNRKSCRHMETIMFLETQMGWTILLKGSPSDELKKIKHAVQFAVFMLHERMRKIRLLLMEAASLINGETEISKCNSKKNENGMAAVFGSGHTSVLISTRNATRDTACKQTSVDFDRPIGMFLKKYLFNQKLLCETCKEPPQAHISCYAHQNRRITVEVRRLPPHKRLPRENEGMLWMWNVCEQCKSSKSTTKRVLVPLSLHGVSFGKIIHHAFSDLSAWKLRLGCGHLFYHHFSHFFGLGSMAVRFTYSTVPTVSVSLPPTVLPKPHKNSSHHDEDGFFSSISSALHFLQLHNNSSDLPNQDVKSDLSLNKMSSFTSPNWFCLCSPDSTGYQHPVITLPTYSVACLFPDEFVALRRHFGLSEPDFISSLRRCKRWDAKGGKSNSFFVKTLDDRFIIKTIKNQEFTSFLEMGLKYFQHMTNGQTTCFAKFLGVYQITEKDGRKQYDVIVMENVFCGREVSIVYDLKGRPHARFNPATNPEQNTLFDKNFLDYMKLSQIYVHPSGVWKLRRAILNDTSFLEASNVMDFSLLVGVDTKNNQLICALIDFLGPYNWEKILESFAKSFTVPKDQPPTVIPPAPYKKRFVDFIEDCFSDPSDPIWERLPEKYMKVVSEKPITLTSIPGAEEPSDVGGNLRGEEIIDMHLQESYINRVEDLKEAINNEEEIIICDWMFSSKGGKSDQLSKMENLQQEIIRATMESLMSETEIFAYVIDSWVEHLNHEEQLRSKDSTSKLFCKTSMTSGYMEDDTINDDRRLHLFIDNFFDSVGDDNDKRTLTGIDLVFFPVVRNGHIYVLVLNLKRLGIDIIDNSHAANDIGQKYGILPKNLHLMLVKYMRFINHPKAENMCTLHVTPHRLTLPLRTLDNCVDCGIFTMRQMETYKGELFGRWKCGLAEGSRAEKTLINLRFKYAVKLLLHDINIHQDKMVNGEK